MGSIIYFKKVLGKIEIIPEVNKIKQANWINRLLHVAKR